MDCVSFSKAFHDNMRSLGLDAPTGLFSSLQTALGTMTTMLGALKALGPDATVKELIGATTALEKLGAVGAMAVSYYVGAALGSMIVATEAVKACSDTYRNSPAARYRAVGRWIASRGLVVPMDIQIFMQRHPEVLTDVPARRSYAMRALQVGAAK
ncbi:hypothetical protein [Trinickia dinghuensis]|uniref:Uncharacterized protein n=1 Tax=Trinickia dinghuensis TaxID=2291023 RepID=A0A3D8JWB7_9BURK|nr:hypothetical protein [Trinickia dinghuensis]RDU96671.1 hypothetical protein DWV00_21970 [Trinickia dinghuensis]